MVARWLNGRYDCGRRRTRALLTNAHSAAVAEKRTHCPDWLSFDVDLTLVLPGVGLLAILARALRLKQVGVSKFYFMGGHYRPAPFIAPGAIYSIGGVDHEWIIAAGLLPSDW